MMTDGINIGLYDEGQFHKPISEKKTKKLRWIQNDEGSIWTERRDEKFSWALLTRVCPNAKNIVLRAINWMRGTLNGGYKTVPQLFLHKLLCTDVLYADWWLTRCPL